MGIRRLSGLVVAIATIVALCGCSLFEGGRVLDILGEDNDVRERLSAIADDVAKVAGVSSVNHSYDYAARTDHVHGAADEYQLELRVEVTAGADVARVADAVRRGYSDEGLGRFTKRLLVVAGEGRLIEQLTFAMAASELALDVHYRAAVSAAIGGDLTMTLADADSVGEAYSRLFSTHDTEVTDALIENYADVVVLADPSTSSHSWDLPGLWVFGALPSPAYLKLLGDLGDIVPFRSNADEWEHPVDGVSLGSGDRAGWAQGPSFLVTLERHHLPVVADVARSIAESGVAPVTLEYPHGDRYNVVRFGDCQYGTENADEQGAFVEQLATEGVPVTVIENAGSCAQPKL